MEHSAVLDKNNRVTLTKDLQRSLGILPGDKVEFVRDGDSAVMIRKYCA